MLWRGGSSVSTGGHAATVDWIGSDRIGLDRIGSDWIEIFYSLQNNNNKEQTS